jgi:hypothetical protein
MGKNGGARPGAGRPAGKPNRQSALRVQEAVQQGRRLPHEALMLIAERALAMAARFQPELTQDDGTKADNPRHDPREFAAWLNQAREAYNNAAPYYAPKLAAVAAIAKIDDPAISTSDAKARFLQGVMNLIAADQIEGEQQPTDGPDPGVPKVIDVTPEPNEDDGDGVLE